MLEIYAVFIPEKQGYKISCADFGGGLRDIPFTGHCHTDVTTCAGSQPHAGTNTAFHANPHASSAGVFLRIGQHTHARSRLQFANRAGTRPFLHR